MKRLSRKQHGYVDYGVAALELALSFALPASAATRRLLRVSAANAALLGALTRHELGIVKLIPMRAHLALDGLYAAAFVAAPPLLPDDARIRRTLVALGLSGALIAALTDPDRG